MKRIKLPPMGASVWSDLLWALLLFGLIMAAIFFYTGGESRFIYTDF